jgi:predicted alpha-1,6-mannanase (GH76 family)
MKIKFDTELQNYIADLLWTAQTLEEVDEIICIYGKEAQVVKDMMVAEMWDQHDDTFVAKPILDRIFQKQ